MSNPQDGGDTTFGDGPQKIVASGGLTIKSPAAAIPTEDEENE